MSIRKTTGAALLALAVSAAAAAPAPAQTTGHTITTFAHSEAPTREDRTVTCAAYAQGASATVVDECYLRGQSTGTIYRVGDRDATPGPADAVTGLVSGYLYEYYDICVRARALFPDGVIYATPLQCKSTRA